MSKDSPTIGYELSQLARFLFDDATNNWYSSLGLQIIVGIAGTGVTIWQTTDNNKFGIAVGLFALLGWAYYLRIRFDENYDRAETMRRQAALSEGIGFPISDTQVSEWRRRVGSKILKRFDSEPRPDNYYASQKPIGSRRLLEMTIESAFYTRHLYSKLKEWIWLLLIGALILSFAVLTVLPFDFIPKSILLKAAYTLYLLLPILLSIDLLLWALRLERLSRSIYEIEKDMENLSKENNPQESHVIRLVSEYNCQVAYGTPIHNWLFKIWHDEINLLWNKRRG